VHVRLADRRNQRPNERGGVELIAGKEVRTDIRRKHGQVPARTSQVHLHAGRIEVRHQHRFPALIISSRRRQSGEIAHATCTERVGA